MLKRPVGDSGGRERYTNMSPHGQKPAIPVPVYVGRSTGIVLRGGGDNGRPRGRGDSGRVSSQKATDTVIRSDDGSLYIRTIIFTFRQQSPGSPSFCSSFRSAQLRTTSVHQTVATEVAATTAAAAPLSIVVFLHSCHKTLGRARVASYPFTVMRYLRTYQLVRRPNAYIITPAVRNVRR